MKSSRRISKGELFTEFSFRRKDHQSQMERIAGQLSHSVEDDSPWRERPASSLAWRYSLRLNALRLNAKDSFICRVHRNKVAVLQTSAVSRWEYGEIEEQLQQPVRRLELRAAASVRAGYRNSERWRSRWRHKTWNLTKASPKINGSRNEDATRLVTASKRTKSVEISSATASFEVACHTCPQPHGRSFASSSNNRRANDNLTRANAPESQSAPKCKLNILERQAKKDWRSDHNWLWRQLQRRVPNCFESERKLLKRRRLSLSHELTTVSHTNFCSTETPTANENPKTYF